MEYAVEIENLSKKYPLVKRYRDIILHPLTQEKMAALVDISFSIYRGELFGLLGPNGAGKTTLLKILATLILPDAGRVRVNGFDVEKKPGHIKRSMGFVVNEERSFYWRLTGLQNLEFFACLNNINRYLIPERVDKVLALVGLKQEKNRMFKDYSAGMKQRLAIARSLLAEPDILIMDEPTRSLDPAAARSLRDFVRKELVEKRGKTVCMSTHNLHEAEDLCDRVAILHKGRLLACRSPRDIKSLLPATRVLEIRIMKEGLCSGDSVMEMFRRKGYNPAGLVEEGQKIKLSIEKYDISAGISGIVTELADMGFTVTACLPRETTLEEAFDKLVEE
ncbi:MAG TPA: ABC transporter ATP-binding protein [bacterium]|nr:ABC transporter ATP-binding protein [bacterium]